MRLLWMVGGVLMVLLGSPAFAADPEPKAAAVENKAEVLEQKVADKAGAAPVPKVETITPSEVQKVDPAGKAPLDDPITCLSRSIYWEAKGITAADMEAVASVVMNRLGHEGFPDTVCGVVKQGVETRACQFSWWCDGRSDQVQEGANTPRPRKSRARR